MNPVISWLLFLTVSGAILIFYASRRSGKKPGRRTELLGEKAKPAILKAFGGTDATEAKKKLQPKKKKAKKAALSNTVAKDVASTDDGDNPSDNDVAQEIGSADVAKRLQTIKQGIKPSASRPGGRQGNLAPSVPPYAASQTSSTGGDADIDEEEITGSDYKALPKSSSDPSDMLEAPTPGPGVLRIGAPIHPPRSQKKKNAPSVPETGIHASKNAKKKEKKKADRDAERAEQQARFEQHRKSMRMQEASQQRLKPASAQSSQPSVWPRVNGKDLDSAPDALVPQSSSVELLDTFVPPSHTGTHNSADENLKRSTLLGDSWESIPQGSMVPELAWNEVKGRKTRKDKKGDESEATKSADEYKLSPVAVAEPIKVPNFLQKKDSRGSSPAPSKIQASKNLKPISSTDWAEVDNLDNWAVHPESSDF